MSKADKDRRRVRAQIRTAEAQRAKVALEGGAVGKGEGAARRVIEPKRAYVPREPGLVVLFGRQKLTRDQVRTGERYGLLYRIAGCEGEAALKSQLGDMFKSFGSGASADPTALEPAALWASVRRELDMARFDGLRSQATMIATCDVVCGKEWTPGQVTPDRFAQLQIETTLRLALDLLQAFWKERPPQTIGIDPAGSGHLVQRMIAA